MESNYSKGLAIFYWFDWIIEIWTKYAALAVVYELSEFKYNIDYFNLLLGKPFQIKTDFIKIEED